MRLVIVRYGEILWFGEILIRSLKKRGNVDKGFFLEINRNVENKRQVNESLKIARG